MKAWTALGAAVFKEHRVLLWIVAFQIEISWWMCVVADRPLWIGVADAYAAIGAATLIFGAMAFAAWLVRHRPRELAPLAGYRESFRAMRGEILTPRWIGSVTVCLLVLPLSLGIFSAAKQTISVIHPFAWDATIEQISLRIHGGKHMWQWLQPVVGHPAVTVLLDAIYHKGWSLIILGTLAMVVVSPRSALRRQYITASVILFFGVGTVAALALSSAGPAYYDHVVKGPDPYASLFVYLDTVGRATPLLSSGGRDVLWSAYRHKVDAFGLGISAMPSMHVATAALVACLGFAVGPWLGAAATLFTFVIAVASVSLGWHYALDGYVGALLAILVWWAAGRLERDAPEAVAQHVTPVDEALDPQPGVWIPPSKRRSMANLPVSASTVSSVSTTSSWANNLARDER